MNADLTVVAVELDGALSHDRDFLGGRPSWLTGQAVRAWRHLRRIWLVRRDSEHISYWVYLPFGAAPKGRWRWEFLSP